MTKEKAEETTKPKMVVAKIYWSPIVNGFRLTRCPGLDKPYHFENDPHGLVKESDLD